MKTVLFAWELGSGYGHVALLQPIAQALRERGHRVVLALRDLGRAERFLGRHGFELMQAPVAMGAMRGMTTAANYAELLTGVGYTQLDMMTSLCRAWRSMYQYVQPDVVIADHAPTALLAADGTGIRRALWGTGFCCPPATSATPNLMRFHKIPVARLQASDAAVLASINQLRERLGQAPWTSLAELYQVDVTALRTFVELDPFAELREVPRYYGTPAWSDEGVQPQWPATGKGRIFAYLRPAMPDFETLLGHLAGSPYAVLVHVPNTPAAVVERFTCASLRFSPEPIRMRDLAGECDAGICPGGHGTIVSLLAAGCPIFMLPMQQEQMLNAVAVSGSGAGIVAVPQIRAPDYPALLERLMTSAPLRASAQQFAARYATHDDAAQLHGIVDAVEAL